MYSKKYLIVLALLFPVAAYASGINQHVDPVASVILWSTLIFFFGLIGRFLAERFHQPGVLGELLMGVLLGNVCYFSGMQIALILREGSAIFNIMREMLSGIPLVSAVHHNIENTVYANDVLGALSGNNSTELIKVAYVVDIFSRYGVIFLLFMAGLESTLDELKHTGRESLMVAIIGVVAPIVLGMAVCYFLMPNWSFNAALFVAATLSATSVGITARVLKELKKLHTHAARTILGAAMIDDILGLIILAIVSSLVINGIVNVMVVSQIILFSCVFFAAVIVIGPRLLRVAENFFSFLEPWEAKLSISFLFVMFWSWLATVVQLAAIIGAFAAGIIIHDNYFDGRQTGSRKNPSIRDLVGPLEVLLAPLFFMLIGIQVKIEAFYDWNVLLMAGGLIVAAIVGKLISGLGSDRKRDRLLIGIGMVPRGEVGIIFASIGRTLGVITDQLFSAIILMVIVTTFIAPIWFKKRYETAK